MSFSCGHYLSHHNLRQRLGSWVENAAELCAPSACISCGQFAANAWCCDSCRSESAFWSPDWCPHCGMPPNEPHSPGCRSCRPAQNTLKIKKLPWSESRCLGTYAGPLRAACLAAKQTQGRWAGSQLVHEWWKMHAAWAEKLGPCLIVPIPRHWSRRWLEGHDPALFLAEQLAAGWKRFGGRQANLIYRRQATPRLAELTIHERFDVMQGLFETHKSASAKLDQNRTVILVDDIWTTGATSISAATCLRAAGAGKIYLVAMARTLELS